MKKTAHTCRVCNYSGLRHATKRVRVVTEYGTRRGWTYDYYCDKHGPEGCKPIKDMEDLKRVFVESGMVVSAGKKGVAVGCTFFYNEEFDETIGTIDRARRSA